MSQSVSCPYCNSTMTFSGTVPTRVNCIRCGESFAYKSALPKEESPRLPSPSLNGDNHAEPLDSKSGSHWPLALFAGLVFLLVVGLGGWAILRKPTPSTVETSTPATAKKVSTFPPSILPSLRYLPADTNIAFALQFGPLQEYAARENLTLSQVLLKVGLTEQLLNAIQDKGLKFSELKTLVGGLAIVGDALIPRMILAVEFLDEPLDRGTLLKNLKATQFTAPRGATRYKVDLGGLPTELQILENKLFLFATATSDLDTAVESKPGTDRLSGGLKDSLKQLSPASLAWVATDAEDWSSKPFVKIVSSLVKQEDWPERLKPYRAATLGIGLEPALGATLSLRGPDPNGGAKLSEKLAANLAGQSEKLKLQFSSEGPWAVVDLPLSGESSLSLKTLFPLSK